MVALGNGQFTLSTVTISHCKLSVGSLQQIVRGQAIFLQHWLFHVPIRGQAGSRAWQGDMCLLIFVTLEQCLVLGWYCKHFSIDVFWILGQICIYIYKYIRYEYQHDSWSKMMNHWATSNRHSKNRPESVTCKLAGANIRLNTKCPAFLFRPIKGLLCV